MDKPPASYCIELHQTPQKKKGSVDPDDYCYYNKTTKNNNRRRVSSSPLDECNIIIGTLGRPPSSDHGSLSDRYEHAQFTEHQLIMEIRACGLQKSKETMLVQKVHDLQIQRHDIATQSKETLDSWKEYADTILIQKVMDKCSLAIPRVEHESRVEKELDEAKEATRLALASLNMASLELEEAQLDIFLARQDADAHIKRLTRELNDTKHKHAEELEHQKKKYNEELHF
eukprot:scaffold6075_cov43-Attheya_sp.AAC.1